MLESWQRLGIVLESWYSYRAPTSWDPLRVLQTLYIHFIRGGDGERCTEAPLLQIGSFSCSESTRCSMLFSHVLVFSTLSTCWPLVVRILFLHVAHDCILRYRWDVAYVFSTCCCVLSPFPSYGLHTARVQPSVCVFGALPTSCPHVIHLFPRCCVASCPHVAYIL